MPMSREQLHELVEGLPEQEIATAQRFLVYLSEQNFSVEFAASVRRGLEQADAGQIIGCRDYNEMVERFWATSQTSCDFLSHSKPEHSYVQSTGQQREAYWRPLRDLERPSRGMSRLCMDGGRDVTA
jgi:hypothetical protein